MFQFEQNHHQWLQVQLQPWQNNDFLLERIFVNYLDTEANHGKIMHQRQSGSSQNKRNK